MTVFTNNEEKNRMLYVVSD